MAALHVQEPEPTPTHQGGEGVTAIVLYEYEVRFWVPRHHRHSTLLLCHRLRRITK